MVARARQIDARGLLPRQLTANLSLLINSIYIPRFALPPTTLSPLPFTSKVADAPYAGCPCRRGVPPRATRTELCNKKRDRSDFFVEPTNRKRSDSRSKNRYRRYERYEISIVGRARDRKIGEGIKSRVGRTLPPAGVQRLKLRAPA